MSELAADKRIVLGPCLDLELGFLFSSLRETINCEFYSGYISNKKITSHEKTSKCSILHCSKFY